MDELGSEDVAIEMMACPVNPSDINTIQGNNFPYPPECKLLVVEQGNLSFQECNKAQPPFLLYINKSKLLLL